MIIKQFNRNKYNVKVNIDSGEGVVLVNLTQGKVKQKMESSHIAYENMLGAELMMEKKWRWHETKLEDQMNNISKYTEVEMVQKGNRQVDPG